MHTQRNLVLPSRRDDRRHAAARQNHAENCVADIDVFEIQTARDRDFALQGHARGVARECHREIALHRDALEVADRDIGSVKGDVHSLRHESRDGHRPAGDDSSATDIRGERIAAGPKQPMRNLSLTGR